MKTATESWPDRKLCPNRSDRKEALKKLYNTIKHRERKTFEEKIPQNLQTEVNAAVNDTALHIPEVSQNNEEDEVVDINVPLQM